VHRRIFQTLRQRRVKGVLAHLRGLAPAELTDKFCDYVSEIDEDAGQSALRPGLPHSRQPRQVGGHKA
jgi:hypothetical protein